MEIRNLENADFETLLRGFERAFADYAISFEKEEVRSMLTRRGFNPRLSFAAFERGEIVAFTLNGTGTFRGVPTAYDTGIGTAKEYRGQSLAGKIFTYSLPFLREAGICQYLLEVLQDNEKAIALYRRMNFEVTREFDCYRQSIKLVDNQGANTACAIEHVELSAIRQAQGFCDFCPSWQNSFESIERGASELSFLGAFVGGEMAGYCVFDSHTGDLTQIAVAGEHRRKGIASRLLQAALCEMTTNFVKVLNIITEDTALPDFLRSRNIPLASKQYEMMLPL